MRGLLLTCLALGACRSTAPYTVPAAALNTGLAVGAAAALRSAGGCYATCVAGTVCNPKTGFCEKPDELGPLVCEEQPGGGLRCVPASQATFRAGGTASGKSTPLPIGISPETGRAPPPPAESSPKPPQ